MISKADHIGARFVPQPKDVEAGFSALTSDVQKFRMSPFLARMISDPRA